MESIAVSQARERRANSTCSSVRSSSSSSSKSNTILSLLSPHYRPNGTTPTSPSSDGTGLGMERVEGQTLKKGELCRPVEMSTPPFSGEIEAEDELLLYGESTEIQQRRMFAAVTTGVNYYAPVLPRHPPLSSPSSSSEHRTFTAAMEDISSGISSLEPPATPSNTAAACSLSSFSASSSSSSSSSVPPVGPNSLPHPTRNRVDAPHVQHMVEEKGSRLSSSRSNTDISSLVPVSGSHHSSRPHHHRHSHPERKRPIRRRRHSFSYPSCSTTTRSTSSARHMRRELGSSSTSTSCMRSSSSAIPSKHRHRPASSSSALQYPIIEASVETILSSHSSIDLSGHSQSSFALFPFSPSTSASLSAATATTGWAPTQEGGQLRPPRTKASGLSGTHRGHAPSHPYPKKRHPKKTRTHGIPTQPPSHQRGQHHSSISHHSFSFSSSFSSSYVPSSSSYDSESAVDHHERAVPGATKEDMEKASHASLEERAWEVEEECEMDRKGVRRAQEARASNRKGIPKDPTLSHRRTFLLEGEEKSSTRTQKHQRTRREENPQQKDTDDVAWHTGPTFGIDSIQEMAAKKGRHTRGKEGRHSRPYPPQRQPPTREPFVNTSRSTSALVSSSGDPASPHLFANDTEKIASSPFSFSQDKSTHPSSHVHTPRVAPLPSRQLSSFSGSLGGSALQDTIASRSTYPTKRGGGRSPGAAAYRSTSEHRTTNTKRQAKGQSSMWDLVRARFVSTEEGDVEDVAEEEEVESPVRRDVENMSRRLPNSSNPGIIREESRSRATLANLPTYSSTSFVRAYVSKSDLSLTPAVIVSSLTAVLNMMICHFLQRHVLDTVDHLGLFLIGSYLVFTSYYTIYYFLERYSFSFQRIQSKQKKFYIIGNLLKAGVLISITPFAAFHLTKIIVFDEWNTQTLQTLGSIYVIPDFISMIVVKRMRWSTWIHHLCVVLFNYFSIMNDYRNENVLRCVVVYASFSSFAYCVNVLLASRFLGLSVNAAHVLSFFALLIYGACCAVNWSWQAYYLHRLLTTGHQSWPVFLYMGLITVVVYDDLVLNKWLWRYASNMGIMSQQPHAGTE